MKTDKFDDAIRRKLESIEPPFRERDWSHMQAFMHYHGFPPAWVGVSQWLGPMAAAAAVTGLLVSAVWQFHTNRQLSQSVQTLSQTVARLETTQAKLLKLQTRTDTVYVTNFTKTPVPATAPQSPADQPVQRTPSSEQAGDRYAFRPVRPGIGNGQAQANAGSRQPAPVDNQYSDQPSAPANRFIIPNRPAQRPTEQPATGTTRALPDAPAQRLATGDATRSVSAPTGADRITRTPTNETAANATAPAERRTDHRSSGAGATGSPSMKDQPAGTQAYTTRALPGRDDSQRTSVGGASGGAAPTSGNGAELRQISSIALLSIRPLVVDSAYYVERVARRTRQIRSILPAMATTLPATNAPTEVTGSRPAFGGFRVRLGATGEISSKQQAVGVYSEVVIGQHWSVGVGLNQLSREGGRFIDDEQFDRMTHNNFRQLYAKGIPFIHDITNIDRKFTVWQLPVNLTYRALLGKGFAVMPSVGMDFSLSAQDNTTFTYRRGFEYPNVGGKPLNRPCESFNAFTIVLGAEKSWKHLIFQAGPVLSMPTRSLPDPINPVTLSLRTRILFQF